MAAGLLSHALAAQPEPLKSLEVVSAGVAARPGEAVSENSVIALKKVGIDIGEHRASVLTPEMVKNAVAIFCMTETHRAMIDLHYNPPADRVFLFREFMSGDVEREIADPFGGSLRTYEACRDEMVEAVPAIIDFLKKRFKVA